MKKMCYNNITIVRLYEMPINLFTEDSEFLIFFDLKIVK